MSGKTEALLDGVVQLWLDPGTDPEPDVLRPLIVAYRLAQQKRHDHSEVMHDGRLRLVRSRATSGEDGTVRLDLAIACQNGTHQGQTAGVHVIERQRIEDPILRGSAAPPSRRATHTGSRKRPHIRATGRIPSAVRWYQTCRGYWPAFSGPTCRASRAATSLPTAISEFL